MYFIKIFNSILFFFISLFIFFLFENVYAHDKNENVNKLVKKINDVDLIENRVQSCIKCHGFQGQGNGYFPRIAGQPVEYLFHQLQDFRDERRQYPEMNYLVKNLSDEFLYKISNYFSKLNPLHAKVNYKNNFSFSTLMLGKNIFLYGNKYKNIKKCIKCHKENGQNNVPNIMRLDSDYISSRFGSWYYNISDERNKKFMHNFCLHLTNEDIEAISQWLTMKKNGL